MAEAKNADLAAVMERLDALERENAALRGASGALPLRPAPRKPPTERTGTNTHRANQRGYDSQAGIFYEEGQIIAPGVVVSDVWMDEIARKDRALARALDDALSADDADVNIEALHGDALTAYAAGLSINRGTLNDKNLRAAVAAKRADTA